MRHLNPNSKKASAPSLSHQHAATGQRVPLPTSPRRPHLCSTTPAGRELRRRRRSQLTGDTPLFFFFFYARDPFSICLEPPRFQEPLPLPQIPRTARHAAVDTSHQRKRRRREPNSANRLLSRFSSHARDGCHSPCDSPPPRQPHCD